MLCPAISLSAYLAEITKDSKYTNAALLSAQWIKAHNINSNNIVLDTVNGHDCSRSAANWLFTYNSGKYVEGLSVLATVTGDSQWTSLYVKEHSVFQFVFVLTRCSRYTVISNAAMKTNAWAGSDGIITEGASRNENNDGVGFKGPFADSQDAIADAYLGLWASAVFIRGLHEVFTRSKNDALKILIHSYIDVQVRIGILSNGPCAHRPRYAVQRTARLGCERHRLFRGLERSPPGLYLLGPTSFT